MGWEEPYIAALDPAAAAAAAGGGANVTADVSSGGHEVSKDRDKDREAQPE